ncbi:SMP-30/gluconolactonase/LRE family protein [Candidatus Poriferisodalis sp.]|uniref:SMP-30/gluconolactonase/LRE family protein n=1 Tax=Candidatus Poriferisodalis sp. TaxID=3101277 RepID=UPI003B023D9F
MTTTEVVVTGLAFGEGPRWHDGRLWYSDMFRHGIFAATTDGAEELMHTVPTQPSGLGWLPDGDLLFVSMLDRQLRRLDADGNETLHADLSGIAAGPCNDMVVAADGTAYVGNFGFDDAAGETFAQATLAIVGLDGTVRPGPAGLDFPNGTAIDASGRHMVLAESFGSRLTAFEIESDGSLTGRRTFADLGGRVPDGICMDEAGGIWAADPVNASCIRVVDGGEVTDVIELEMNCYACMLGDDDRRTLYLMTAPTHVPSADQSRPGRIERCRVDVPGAGLP